MSWRDIFYKEQENFLMASLMAGLMDAKILIFMAVMEELRLDSLIILLNICFSVRACVFA